MEFRSILVILLLTACYSEERNCLPFHEGTFEYATVINGEIKTSRFDRKENFEIEYYEGKIDSASIRWVNDCECVLTKLNPVSNQDRKPLQMRILTTQEASYTFEFSYVGDAKNKQRGTIRKIIKK